MSNETKTKREWYSVSYTSVAFFSLVVLSIVGVMIYRNIDLDSLENRAGRIVDEAEDRVEALRTKPDIQGTEEFRKAEDLLNEATGAYTEENYERALESGEECLIFLHRLENQGKGSIRVLSAQGSVEHRRGEKGSWKRLRTHDTLTPGDWVKTASDGTARLVLGDDSVFTLRQSTMVHLGGALGIGGDDEATNIEFGRVELNTRTNDSTVTTPGSRARVRRDSEALVSFDRDKRSGRYAAYSGGLEVTSDATGETRRVEALQQVNLLGDKLSEISNLPGKPVIAGPADDHVIELGRDEEVKLAWEPVDNAQRYELRVAGNRLFSTRFIDDRRTKTSARIGVRREGQFFWQVAALDAQGNPGPWSDERSFRATSASRAETVSDEEPPPLKIVSHDTYGSMVIVNGRTESGATVTINKQPVNLKSDGTFSARLQMTKAGTNQLEIVATDASKNETTEHLQVYIDG